MSEPVTSIESDWLAFCQLPEMKNHWQREGWWPGRTGYYWYLTFEDSPALHQLALACQDTIRNNAAFDLTPIGEIHMTLDRVGFEDEVEDDGLRDAEASADALLRNYGPFTIEVGPLAGSAGALSFSVRPSAELTDLRTCLSEAGPAVATVDGEGAFKPHISIAYRNQPGPAAPVVETVARLRQLPPVLVRVDHVSLVRLTRAERAYQWTAFRTFPVVDSNPRSQAAGQQCLVPPDA